LIFQTFKWNVPEYFNYSHDVVEKFAWLMPQRKAASVLTNLSFFFSYVAKSRDDIVFWGEIFGQKGGKEVFIIFRILSGCRPVSA
jgi:hypothetical protein